MDKKELVEKIESLPSLTSITSIRPYVDKKIVLGLISQLDEPQKVKVPQFVADWIEYFKKCSGTLYGSTAPYSYYGRAITDDFEGDVIEVLEWIRNNSEVYARAWLDGYEIEKEKRYIIKLKGVPDGAKFLKFAKVTQEWYFGMRRHYSDMEVSHTRKQLEEAGFGWVFSCEGIEIEEVTE